MSSDLSQSLRLADFKDQSPLLNTVDVDAVKRIISPTDCAHLSQELGLDLTRVCAAHNIVALSKAADSLDLASIRHYLVGVYEPQDLEQFIIDVVHANPQELAGTLIDEVGEVVSFRCHNPDDTRWRQSVLMSI